MSDNSELIRNFNQAWSKMDLETIMSCFTDDAAYANVPMGPAHVGKDAIRGFIDSFIGNCEDIEFIIHNQIDQGSIVMNERTDRIKMKGNDWVELPVMGVYEIQDGKIAAWRDYFDMAMFAGQ